MIEYISANLWQLWAVIAVLCLIVELSSGDFFLMCFAIGAAGASVASPFVGFYVQLIIFALLSVLCIIRVRPFALRYLNKSDKARPSNADAIIGKVGFVSETIESGRHGRVAVGGDDWKALAVNTETLPVGTRVKVISRESVVITVEKIDN
jgi:membrane protein implicated in regulation of membrane protease activity